MNIIALVGLIGGSLAKLLMPGTDPVGSFSQYCSASQGRFSAAFSRSHWGWAAESTTSTIGTIFLSVVGGMLLLGGYRLVTYAA